MQSCNRIENIPHFEVFSGLFVVIVIVIVLVFFLVSFFFIISVLAFGRSNCVSSSLKSLSEGVFFKEKKKYRISKSLLTDKFPVYNVQSQEGAGYLKTK